MGARIVFGRVGFAVGALILSAACRQTTPSSGTDARANSPLPPMLDSALEVIAENDAAIPDLDARLPKGNGWECRTRLDTQPRNPNLSDGTCWRQCIQPSPIPPPPRGSSAPPFRPPYYPCTHRDKAFCFAHMSHGSTVVECSESKTTCETSRTAYRKRYELERDWSMTECIDK